MSNIYLSNTYHLKWKKRPVTMEILEEETAPFHLKYQLRQRNVKVYIELINQMIKLSDGQFAPQKFEVNENALGFSVMFVSAGKTVSTVLDEKDSDFEKLFNIVELTSEVLMNSGEMPKQYFVIYNHPDDEEFGGIVFAIQEIRRFLENTDYLKMRP